mgnify:CR=1 FL=1
MKKIQYYMSDSQLLKTQKELNGIIDIMKSNMNKVIDRDTKLEHLESQSEILRDDANRFSTSSRRLKNKYWWQNKKWIAVITVVVVVIVGIIVLAAIA